MPMRHPAERARLSRSTPVGPVGDRWLSPPISLAPLTPKDLGESNTIGSWLVRKVWLLAGNLRPSPHPM